MSDIPPSSSKSTGTALKPTIPTFDASRLHSSQPTSAPVASVIQHAESYSEETSISSHPRFQPFFTLVTDASTSTAHHPSQVHYIFADDDPELLTAACLDAIASGSTIQQRDRSSRGVAGSSEGVSATGSGDSHIGQVIENRIVLLDVDETGTRVVKAASLSPTWQILSSNISLAPTWDGAQLGDGNMMLKIEGTDGRMPSNQSGRSKSEKGQEQNTDMSEDAMYALMQEFDERMLLLRTVIGNDTLPAPHDLEEE